MALNKENVSRRDKALKAEFTRLSNIMTPKGKRKLSYEAIIEKLADKFYLSECTVQSILFKKK